jgi:hypothetical protein
VSTPEQDLTGVWDGRYVYPMLLKPVFFTAVILQSGSSISGTIHEKPPNGPGAGKVRNASLEGELTGNAVHFVKVYEPVGGRKKAPIIYDGVLNAEATEIEGRWRIAGNWSGTFMMVRSRGEEVAEEVKEKAREPVRL